MPMLLNVLRSTFIRLAFFESLIPWGMIPGDDKQVTRRMQRWLDHEKQKKQELVRGPKFYELEEYYSPLLFIEFYNNDRLFTAMIDTGSKVNLVGAP